MLNSTFIQIRSVIYNDPPLLESRKSNPSALLSLKSPAPSPSTLVSPMLHSIDQGQASSTKRRQRRPSADVDPLGQHKIEVGIAEGEGVRVEEGRREGGHRCFEEVGG